MEDVLKEINELTGVRGSFICDGHGNVLSTAMPEAYDKEVKHIGREVFQVIALLQMLGEDTDSLDFLFSDGRIVVNGLRDFSLIVFCERNVDISMLRLKSNVSLAEIRRNVRFRKQTERVSKTRKGLSAGQRLDESYRRIINNLRSRK